MYFFGSFFVSQSHNIPADYKELHLSLKWSPPHANSCEQNYKNNEEIKVKFRKFPDDPLYCIWLAMNWEISKRLVSLVFSYVIPIFSLAGTLHVKQLYT